MTKHAPPSDFAPAKAFNPVPYVNALRAAGATLTAQDGTYGGGSIEGTFGVLTPIESNEAVEKVYRQFAPLMLPDKLAVHRVAEFLLEEAATQRARAAIGANFRKAERYLDRIDAVSIPLYDLEEKTLEIYEAAMPDPPVAVRFHPMGGLDADHKDYWTAGGRRLWIFSEAGIEQLRTNPRSMAYCPCEEGVAARHIGDDFEPRNDQERKWVEKHGAEIRQRAAAVVEAYDAWQSECDRIRAESGYQAASCEAVKAGREYYAALNYVLKMPVRSVADAGLKMKIVLQRCLKQEFEPTLTEISAFLLGNVKTRKAAA